jgi:hypothetical protein
LKPIDRFRESLYLYSPKGAQYAADGLRARWGRWHPRPARHRHLVAAQKRLRLVSNED